VRHDVAKTRDIIAAFRRGGGDGKPLVLQYQLSWAQDENTAVAQAHDQWRHAAADLPCADISTPAAFDLASAHIAPDDMPDCMMISADPAAHAADIGAYQALDFDEIYLHNAGRNQKEFIACFGKHVLPRL
jgi:hypothetical protein